MLPVRVERDVGIALEWPCGCWVEVEPIERLVATISLEGEHRRHAGFLDQVMIIASCNEKASVAGMSDNFYFTWGVHTDPENPEAASLQFNHRPERNTFSFDFDVRRAKGQTWQTVLDTYAALDLG